MLIIQYDYYYKTKKFKNHLVIKLRKENYFYSFLSIFILVLQIKYAHCKSINQNNPRLTVTKKVVQITEPLVNNFQIRSDKFDLSAYFNTLLQDNDEEWEKTKFLLTNRLINNNTFGSVKSNSKIVSVNRLNNKPSVNPVSSKT